MRDKEGLIEHYRNADFGERMHLFLEHRALREEFDAVERMEMQTTVLPNRRLLEKLHDFFCPKDSPQTKIGTARRVINRLMTVRGMK